MNEVLQGDVLDPQVIAKAKLGGLVPLIVADPPYGKIVSSHWDQSTGTEEEFCNWMLRWTEAWTELLIDGGAFYVWGGVGKKGFRPFYRYLTLVESLGFTLQPITWEKKRGYGVQNNYLFCREECAYLVKGTKPAIFNVPYLPTERGYAGFNAKYPARSKYLRRTTVWRETEIFRGKLHECQKADRVSEIPIEVHTKPGDRIIELFGGSGSTAAAAQRLGRQALIVEKDSAAIKIIKERLIV